MSLYTPTIRGSLYGGPKRSPLLAFFGLLFLRGRLLRQVLGRPWPFFDGRLSDPKPPFPLRVLPRSRLPPRPWLRQKHLLLSGHLLQMGSLCGPKKPSYISQWKFSTWVWAVQHARKTQLVPDHCVSRLSYTGKWMLPCRRGCAEPRTFPGSP